MVLALLFGLFILWREGTQSALEYYTGYLIELSLSVDNLFVFLLIFSYFCVRSDAQPKVLKWGILGAMVMRLIMIGLGAFLLQRFSWIIYVFGAILVVTGIRMFTQKQEQVDLERNPGGAPGSPVHAAEPELRRDQVLHPHRPADECSPPRCSWC